MNLNLFTYAEAEAKRGLHVRTRLTLMGIPNGTPGTVHRVAQTLDGCFLVIQWDLPLSSTRSRRLQENWFNKDLYATHLVEVVE
jgi:hypothetical protein